MPPEVSVVITTRNRLHYLREAVAAVLTQSLEDLELIVVDDASTDATADWLGALTDERVRSTRLQQHSERSVALNRGHELAQAQKVLFVDDDDRMLPRSLERLSNALDANERSVAAMGTMRWFNDEGQRRNEPSPRASWTGEAWPQILAGANVERGQLMIRTEVAAAAGGWDPATIVSDDTYMALRVSLRGPLTFVPARVLEKRLHDFNTPVDDHPAADKDTRTLFIASLTEPDKARGERSLAFHELWMRAHNLYYDDRRYAQALGLYKQLRRDFPELATAPLIRKRLRRATMKAALGALPGARGAMTALRGVNARVRRAFGRYPPLGSTPQARKERQGP